MATKGAKTGDKRKATTFSEKGEKKSVKSSDKGAKKAVPVAKQNAPESTRKLWRNEDASDDSSDDDASSDAEDAGAALHATKKVKQAKEDGDANKNAGKKVERSMSQTEYPLDVPWSYTDFL